jgi:hypothetical protein
MHICRHMHTYTCIYSSHAYTHGTMYFTRYIFTCMYIHTYGRRHVNRRRRCERQADGDYGMCVYV